MSRPARSARMPLACSIMTRLLRAWLSWSTTRWAWMAARCWRMAMVATSARAWAATRSADSRDARLGAEQVEGTDGDAPQAHGQGLGRLEAGLEGHRPEQSANADRRRPGCRPHRFAGAVAVRAGPLLRLELEQLHQAHLLAGGGHDPQVPFGGHRASGRRRPRRASPRSGGPAGSAGPRRRSHRQGCRPTPRTSGPVTLPWASPPSFRPGSSGIGRASSTGILTRSRRLPPRLPGAARRVTSRGDVEPELPGHDRLGHFGQETFVAEGIGPQAGRAPRRR